ncbi:MAG TPA: rhomboid family intramembrane serine protease [Candidatus Limnocylindrales bacterium]|nr:rhomboid family intramembrane serine protease [Candidatus Limnocylindrales bacterium]
MIPLHDATPARRIPIVTRLLIALNVAIWIYVLYLSRTAGAAEAFYNKYSFDLSALVAAVGGSWSIDTLSAFVPLVTHMFLHGGWLHLIGNMLYLWIFGDNVEDALGSVRFIAFYIVCGITSAIGQGLLTSGPLVGASGAISGVLGAYLLMYPTARIATLIVLGLFTTVIQLPAIIVIGFFIVLQVIEGIAELRLAVHPASQHVAYFAHVFGFLAGILLLAVARQRGAGRARAGWR